VFKVSSVVVFLVYQFSMKLKRTQTSRECLLYSLHNMVAEVKTICKQTDKIIKAVKQCTFFIKQLPSMLLNWRAHVGYNLE